MRVHHKTLIINLFTMSKSRTRNARHEALVSNDFAYVVMNGLPFEARGADAALLRQGFGGHSSFAPRAKNGGAGRDRTDDLKLAKLALSQLSYGPNLAASPNFRLCQPGLKTQRPTAHLRGK